MNGEVLFQQAMQHFSQQNTGAANQLLMQAAQLGHSMATLYLAEQYFRQRPSEAYQFLQQQWNAGVKGTLHRLVTLKAFFDEQTLTSADFDLLHQEAMAGHVESMMILLNLSQGYEGHLVYVALLEEFAPGLLKDLGCGEMIENAKGLQLDTEQKNQLLDAICGQWHARTAHEPLVHVQNCNVKLYKNVVSELFCDYLILRLNSHMKPSMVHDPVTGEGIQNDVRTSYIAHITPEHLDWFTLELDMIIESLSGVSRSRGEALNLLRYENGQEYKPHYDAIVGQGLQFETIFKGGGQRIKTAITYLSDNYLGGETAFPKMEISVKGTKGDVLLFDNWSDDGNVLRDSYHAGRPVTKGTKWILTKWIRESTTHYGGIVYPKR